MLREPLTDRPGGAGDHCTWLICDPGGVPYQGSSRISGVAAKRRSTRRSHPDTDEAHLRPYHLVRVSSSVSPALCWMPAGLPSGHSPQVARDFPILLCRTHRCRHGVVCLSGPREGV